MGYFKCVEVMCVFSLPPNRRKPTPFGSNQNTKYFERIYPGVKYIPPILRRYGITFSLKLVVVGDIGCGKSCMLISYANNSFPDDYVPIVFDQYNATVLFENMHIRLSLWDTHENEIEHEGDYDEQRILSYTDANVVLICFSTVDPLTIESVSKKWIHEVRKHCPEVPIILCGNKLDLREDSQIFCELQERDEKPVTRSEGEKVAKEINACGYFENSALTQKGLIDVFQAAISAVLKKPPNPNLEKDGDNKKCRIM